jgi:hypothetical protein
MTQLKMKLVIDISDNIFSIGSCFALKINKLIKKNGIDSVVNPFGTIYNSYSIYKNIETILLSEKDSESKKDSILYDIVEIDRKFISFDSSTLFESNDYKILVDKLNEVKNHSKKALLNSNVLLITLGTSVVYRYKETNQIVANCHKLSDSFFTKYMLTVDENIDYISKTIELLKENIPNIKIILTLSPIRHNMKNPEENSVSKAILRVAIDSLIDNKSVFYFNAYEIVMDIFRDYSFYKKDKAHLKKSSIKKIMEEFSNKYFSDKQKEYINNFIKLKKNRKHKPFNPKHDKYFDHLKNTFISLYDLYYIRESFTIEKEIFLIGERLFYLFSDKEEALFELFNKLNRDKFYNYFTTVLNILIEKDLEKIDLNNLNLLNKFSRLDRFNANIENRFYLSSRNS